MSLIKSLYSVDQYDYEIVRASQYCLTFLGLSFAKKREFQPEFPPKFSMQTIDTICKNIHVESYWCYLFKSFKFKATFRGWNKKQKVHKKEPHYGNKLSKSDTDCRVVRPVASWRNQ